MGIDDQVGRGRDTGPVFGPGDVVPDRPARGVLHRDPLDSSALAERRLLVVGETECHGHQEDGIKLIPSPGDGERNRSRDDQVRDVRENAEVVPIDPLLGTRPGPSAAQLLDDLYREQRERLRGLAASVMLDWSQADEVVHDAFAGLAPRLGDVDNPEGYLHRSVVNLALRVVKRRGRQLPARPIERTSIPEIDEMWAIVASLPPRQRAVLVLRFWEDLTQEQIADILDIPLGTVKSTLHRALRHLRTQIEGSEER